MDLSALLLSQDMASMPSFGSQEVQSPSLADGENEFGNLLGLVESMETAEMSSGSDDALAKLMSLINDPELKNLSNQKLMAQMNLASNQFKAADLKVEATGETLVGETLIGDEAMLQDLNLENNINLDSKDSISPVNVGQQLSKIGNAEMLTHVEKKPGIENFQNEILTRGIDSLALSKAVNLENKNAQMPKLGIEQVTAWSQALASKEIKNVSVETTLDPIVREKLAATQVLASKLPDAELKAENFTEKSNEIVKPELRSKIAVQSEKLDLKTSAELRDLSQVSAKSAPLQTLAVVPDQPVKSLVSGEKTEKQEPTEAKGSDSVMAKDFMLTQMAGSKVTSKGEGIKIDETKVSKEISDFVAEKVDQLKQSGGETLRVKMVSSDLGGLDIKVTLRRGLVNVDIRADESASQAVLNASSSQLKERLNKVVDLGDLDVGMNFKAVQQTKIGQDAAVATLSHDIVRGMTKAESASANLFSQSLNRQSDNMIRLDEMSASNNGQGLGQSTQDFAREDKRE